MARNAGVVQGPYTCGKHQNVTGKQV
jgi:hypothetical protein